MKYLLIDGNNLAIRSAFANSELKNRDGISTSIHYGVFQSLINLKQKYLNYQMLLVWDGKSKRRIKEALEGVEQGIIKSGYKANRVKDVQPQPLLDFREQAPYLKKGIEQAGIPQIRLYDFEADDVIASYCFKLKSGNNEIIAMTSDKDYYQLLDTNVDIWDGMKCKLTTKTEWESENKITPSQYVDCGALMGDVGDNIFGIPGWGDKGAFKAIRKHGSWENVMVDFHKNFDSIRQKFPDLNEDENEFKKLENIKTKSGKQKYPEIKIDMPFTGVTLAVENKQIKTIPKTTLMALMMEKRVKLAYSLKKMDIIEDLPDIQDLIINKDRLIEYFDYYDIKSFSDYIEVF